MHFRESAIRVENTQVRVAEEIRSGFGTDPFALTLELSPLAEPFYWLMPQEDVRKLCLAALATPNNLKGFTTPSFQEGFYRFLCLKVAQMIDELSAFEDLSVKIAPQRPLPMQEALCMDVAIKISRHTLWGRLICPHPFRQALKSHFSKRSLSFFESPMAKEISVTLHATVGKTLLPFSRWKEVKVGDFIRLDHCSFDPSTQKGTLLLTLDSTPLLHARLKSEGIKIVDYAFYHEESMNENEYHSDEEDPSESGEEEIPVDQGEHLWSAQPQENQVEEFIPADEIPLSLTVEVARLKIKLDKLLQLKPGNVLELPVRPEQGVDISIGGKKMAKAELIKLGDVLGIKILHLGDSV